MPNQTNGPLHRTDITGLNPPSEYFPIQNGRYQVSAGLSWLGTDFGNGSADAHVFQFDNAFHHYREAKLQARSEKLHKYVCSSAPSPGALRALGLFFLHRLADDFPTLFNLQKLPNGQLCLHCSLTNEVLFFSQDGSLSDYEALHPVIPPYESALDALACQVQEDLALIQWIPGRGDWLSALHLCFPNHWSAEEKIGRDFSSLHEQVPEFKKIAAQSDRLVKSMINKGPFVRFAWGIATDTDLNHHPLAPPSCDPDHWPGRRFNANNPMLYLRVERQTVNGFADKGAALFTIRTYFTDIAQLQPQQLTQLHSGLRSMSPEVLQYKGLATDKDRILDYIDHLQAIANIETAG